MPLKRYGCPGCSKTLLSCAQKLHTGQYVIYGGYRDPSKLKF
jgi:hypothetical protein